MTEPTITISLSYTVAADVAPALLQKLLAVLPAGAVAGSTGSQAAHAWPEIPASAHDAYRKIAAGNLTKLQNGTIDDDGWGNVKDLPKVIASLRGSTKKVIQRAIDNGGHVSRDEVYELIGRGEEQSLKGFTRPATAITQRLTAAGELGPNALPLLKPIYAKSKSYQQAQGFVVPLQVVRLLKLQRQG